MSYYGKPNKSKNPDDDSFFQLSTFMPKNLAKLLQRVSDEKRIPLSRLIAFAVDNEATETADPFRYDVELPKTPFVEYAYADEAGRLLQLIKRFSRGIGRDSLMLLRHEAEIEKRETFLYAYRELLEMKQIEEYRPRNTKFDHGPDYLYARWIGSTSKLVKGTFKRVEGRSVRAQPKALSKYQEQKKDESK